MSNFNLLREKIRLGHSPEKTHDSSGEVYSIFNKGVQISVAITKVYRDGWGHFYSISLDDEDVSGAFTKSELEDLAIEIKKVYNNHIKAEADSFIKSKFNKEIETISPAIPKSYWKYGDWSR